jgi:hypothetical protein
LEDISQIGIVNVCLLEQLLNARLVLRPPDAGGNGDDVLCVKNFGR